VRNQALALFLAFLVSATQAQSLVVMQSPETSAQNPAQTKSDSAQTAAPVGATDTAKTLLPGQFILQDSTPVKLRLSRNVSSADAHEGESVDFEVLEDVAATGIVVIPKGSIAIATVTEVQPKRRMGRAGKLEIVLDYVRLADTEKAAIRAVKDAKGGSHTVGMTAGIVATGLLFFPAAPFFLFMHGKDITIPKGAEVTGYINGDVRLDTAKFNAKPAELAAPAGDQSSASQVASPNTAGVPDASIGIVQLQSTPDGAEVYLDGEYVGNVPAKLKLKAGKHSVRLELKGYKTWAKDLMVQAGSAVSLSATLEQ